MGDLAVDSQGSLEFRDVLFQMTKTQSQLDEMLESFHEKDMNPSTGSMEHIVKSDSELSGRRDMFPSDEKAV
uniref:IMD domain-containing protein n=1 Tax=Mus spicilegus TaxID=10103 RepID=A0A8C6HTA5_MUSSI